MAGAAVLQPTVTSSISDAMFAELAGQGYARMSMEAVARAAGVGKAALYRRWPSKRAMVIDLVADAIRRTLPEAIDTGSLAGDVRAFLDFTVAQARKPSVVQVALDMLAESARDETLAAELRDVAAVPRRDAARKLLERAGRRGEIPPDIDVETGIDLLISPLVFRLALTRGAIDDRYLDVLTNATVAALASARS